MSDSYSVETEGFPDRGPSVFAVTTGTLTLCSTFVAARLYCRAGIVRRVSWDDYFILLAWLLAFGLSFTIDFGTRKGLGRHDANIVPADRGSLRRCEYAFSILYNPALMAAKTSILIFYLRLAKDTQKVLRLASYAVLGVVNVAGTVLTLINIFQCRPVDAAFNQVNGQAQCIPLLTEFICSAPVNVVTDLAILALPLPVLTGMRLPSRQKTILVITFALGIFVTVVDVIRIYYLQQAIAFIPTGASSDPNSIFGDSSEFSWNASLSLMWSAVEVNVGITCACIPTLKPLIIKILPAMITDPEGTRTTEAVDLETSIKHASKEVHALKRVPSHPTTSSQDAGGDSEGVTMLDFLTTPDMVGGEPGAGPASGVGLARQRLQQQMSTTTVPGAGERRPENRVYFGFVKMKRPKSMLRTSVADSWKYCTVVTILFFLWGFSYGLLNTLNNVVAAVAHMTTAQTLGLTSAYFGGGYLFGPLLVGEWVLRHDEHRRSKRRSNGECGLPDGSIGGFKATFMVGLCFYGTGTIMFWPSAVLTSFPGFLISNFVVGFGLSILETAANPFIALCGPGEYAEMRLLLAQGVQGVGSVLSGLLAQNVYFGSIGSSGYTDSMTLLDVQWTYLAITLLSVALALMFYYMPLPEVSDAALERAASKLPVDTNKRSIGGYKLRTVCLVIAVVANWTYVAAQESMSVYGHALLTSWLPASESSTFGAASDTAPSQEKADQPEGFAISIPNYLLIAHTAFTVSRFATGGVAYLSVKHPRHRFIPTPRTILVTSTALSCFFALLIVILKPKQNPNLIVLPVVLYFLAEGPIWPLIFSMGLRGQGKQTKRAAAWLTVGGSGPAFWPYVMYGIINGGGTVQIAFIVVVFFFATTLSYPLFLTFGTDARAVVEGHLLGNAEGAARRPAGGGAGGGMAGPESPEESSSRLPGLGTEELGEERRRRREGPTVENGGIMGKVSRSLGGGSGAATTATMTDSVSRPDVEHAEDGGEGGRGGVGPDIPDER